MLPTSRHARTLILASCVAALLPAARASAQPVPESDRIPVENPSPDGKGTIPVMVTCLWDPDGYFAELNKILGTPAGKVP